MNVERDEGKERGVFRAPYRYQMRESYTLFHRGGVSIVSLIFFLFTAMLTYWQDFEYEETLHMQAQDFVEGVELAVSSYQFNNARLGELLMYLGGHFNLLAYRIANPVMLLILLFVVVRLATGAWPARQKRGAILLFFAALYILAFHSGLFWYAANTNWLYPCTAAACFFVMAEPIFHRCFRFSAGRLILLIPLAFLVGWSNENTSIISPLLYMAPALYSMLKGERPSIGSSYLLVLASMIAGSLIFNLAPARAARTAYADWHLTWETIWSESILSWTNWAYAALAFWRPLVSLAAIIGIARWSGIKLRDPRLNVLTAAWVAYSSVLVLAPAWGAPRAYMCSDIVLACILTRMFWKLAAKGKRKSVLAVLLLQIAVMSTAIVPLAVNSYAQHRVWKKLENMAQFCREKGERILYVRKDQFVLDGVMPRIAGLPSSVIDYKSKPFLPLLSAPAHFSGDIESVRHVRGHLPYRGAQPARGSGDDFLNRMQARRLGLDAVILK